MSGNKIIAAFLPVVIVAGLLSFASDPLSGILKPGTEPEKLADGFSFTEGPSCNSKGEVYFTDQPNDRILIWNESTGLRQFLNPSGRSNGLAFDSNDNLWACADEKNELWIIKPDKSIVKIPSLYKNKVLNGPNDLYISPSGRIYFTDPFYKRPWWDHSEVPQDCRAVYFLSADKEEIIRVASDLVQPNGIVGTDDGKKLFIADIGAGKTYSYYVGPDGLLKDKKLFCEMGSDGMAIDTKGNIYLTGDGVTIFDKNGRKLGNIKIPEKWTANVCFGGADMKTLYITASKGFYSIRLKVKGTKA